MPIYGVNLVICDLLIACSGSIKVIKCSQVIIFISTGDDPIIIRHHCIHRGKGKRKDKDEEEEEEEEKEGEGMKEETRVENRCPLNF